MKKIGLYLSVGPRAGGSFQYCLSVIKYLQNLIITNMKLLYLVQMKFGKKDLIKNLK